MTNLFSIFDPSLSIFSFSWFLCCGVCLMVPGFFWLGGSLMSSFLFIILSIKKEVDYVLSLPVKGLYLFFCSILLTLILYNFLSLFPHIFSLTSHMLVTFPFSYSFWLAVIFFSWVSSLKHYLSHLIPVGTPIALISFMVLVEVLSSFIRPLALTFRLTANMMAGHLLMSLIGSSLVSLSFSVLLPLSFFQSSLVFMELGVSIIQSYVFFTLLLLYVSEGESVN